MKCKKCGFDIPRGNSFCVACGTTVGQQMQQPMQRPPQGNNYQPPPQGQYGQQQYGQQYQGQYHSQHQQPYGQPPQSPQQPRNGSKKWTPLMIVGFVLSIAGCALAVWFWWSISWFGLVMSIMTLGLGIAGLIIGLKNKREHGKHPAIIVGIVLGAVALGLGAVGLVFMISCIACIGAVGCALLV